MAQNNQYPKFERNLCNRFRDNRCHRRTDAGRTQEEFRLQANVHSSCTPISTSLIAWVKPWISLAVIWLCKIGGIKSKSAPWPSTIRMWFGVIIVPQPPSWQIKLFYTILSKPWGWPLLLILQSRLLGLLPRNKSSPLNMLHWSNYANSSR